MEYQRLTDFQSNIWHWWYSSLGFYLYSSACGSTSGYPVNKMQRKLDSFSLPILAGVHHKIYITLPNIFLFLVFTPMVPQLFKCADLLILLPKVVFNSFYLKSQVSPLLGFFSQLKKLSLWSVNHRTESLRCLRGVESHYCPSYSFGISKEM